MTERRRPVHLAVGLGVSAGVYAISLAAVTGLQADADAALRTERAPAVAAIAELKGRNDRLAAEIDAAGAAYGVVADRYREVARGLSAIDGPLATLATTVAGIEGAAVALPARAPLPSVSRARSVSAPTTHATTGASGR